ncbi:hypothetical protein [Endozoicomonas ascidiicola]|uniref:hypothetical protein n=1 Tax=Endozoicomonas ascidiicola TaxID=1698521 RepID=UPI0012FB533E|nr:hypothetical protein [Endozoicomonas ascidiicola]
MSSIYPTLKSHVQHIAQAYKSEAGTAPQNSQIREEIHTKINALFGNKTVEFIDNDTATRPVAVGIQTIFEQALHKLLEDRDIQATVIIHTKYPATPLCTEEAATPSDSLMGDNMRDDPNRKSTITERATTLRNLAKAGDNVRLLIAYPEDGLSERSDDKQRVYKEELNNPQNKSLRDIPLNLLLKDMPEELIGASYIIEKNQSPDRESLAFLIRGAQAVDSDKINQWTLDFGDFTSTTVSKKYKDIKAFLEKNTTQDLKLPSP